MKKYIESPFFTPFIVLALFLLSVTISITFFPNLITDKDHKNMAIETATYSAYAFMFLAFIYFIKKFYKDGKFNKDYFVYFFVALAALFREMGIQHWIPSKDSTAFKSRFFLNPENPLSEKIIAGTLLLLFAVAIAYLAIKYSKYLINSFLNMNTVTWSIAVLCTVGVISKIVDRFPSNYRKYTGFSLEPTIRNNLVLMEEISEIFLPIIVIFILIQYNMRYEKKAAN